MNAKELIQVFQDTLSVTRCDPAIAAKTAEAIRHTIVYEPNFHAPIRETKRNDVRLQVVQGGTLDTARSRGIGKTAALNFANPIRPGGGVCIGVRAQEEALCRCSNLYDTLSTEALQTAYYKWHAENTDNLFSDKVIYIPDIQVVKDDSYAPLETPCSVDIITCAAPYNEDSLEDNVLYPIYVSRITNILEVSMDQNVDTIVLGAFGCGAFFNPPQLMASAFREVLIDRGYARYFKQVIFAILTPHLCHPNYTVFHKELTK